MTDVALLLLKLMPNGELVPLFTSSTGHYGGQCPNVGDTIGTLWPDAEDEHYAVSRRYFYDQPDGSSIWAVVLRELSADPVLERVTCAIRRSQALDRQAEREANQRMKRLAAEQADELMSWLRPRPADKRIVGILRWLATHKAGKTYRQIARAGERTVALMVEKGFVEACGEDRDGLVRVRITAAGREVVRLDDEWERHKEEQRQR